MADVYWDDVTLLLNFTGADGSTTFTDESSDERAVTANGDAQIQSNELELDGSGDYITLANSAALLDTTGPFTAELFVTLDNTSAIYTFFECRDGSGGFRLAASTTSLSAQGTDSGGDTLAVYINSSTGVLSASTKHHVALTRDGSGDWRAFCDGVQAGSTVSESASIPVSGSTFYIGSFNGTGGHLDGSIDALRLTNGVARYTSNFTPPTEFELGPPLVRIESPSPLGAPEVLVLGANNINIEVVTPLGAPAVVTRAHIPSYISVPSPLGAPAARAFNNFSSLAGDQSVTYVMRVTGSPVLEIPISSWQGTIQSDRQDYVSCVVPAEEEYADELATRRGSEEFVIYRTTVIDGVQVESEMARAPLSTVVVNQGPFRETATLSGYSETDTEAQDLGVVELTGVRTITNTYGGNSRIRSDIDWFLRPGNECTADGLTITATYINYYVTESGQEYMDVGTR